MVKKKINLKDITIIIPAKIIEKNLINCVDVCKKKYPDTPVIIVLDYLDKKKIIITKKKYKISIYRINFNWRKKEYCSKFNKNQFYSFP